MAPVSARHTRFVSDDEPSYHVVPLQAIEPDKLALMWTSLWTSVHRFGCAFGVVRSHHWSRCLGCIKCSHSIPAGFEPHMAVMVKHGFTDVSCNCHQRLVGNTGFSQPGDAMVAQVMKPDSGKTCPLQ
jgi:hypothetical protein